MMTSVRTRKYNLPDKPLHEYVFNRNGQKVTIEAAVRGGEYYDKHSISMIVKKGDIKAHHFAYKAATGDKLDTVERTESNTIHDAVIAKIKYEESPINFTISHPDFGDVTLEIPFDNIVVEKMTLKHLGNNRIPDVTLLDKDGNVIALIEVVCTHECPPQKIKELEKLNLLTIELYYGDMDNIKGWRIFGNKEFQESVTHFGVQDAATEGLEPNAESIRKRIREVGQEKGQVCHETDRLISRIDKIKGGIVGFEKETHGLISGETKLSEGHEEVERIKSGISSTQSEIHAYKREIQRITEGGIALAKRIDEIKCCKHPWELAAYRYDNEKIPI